jgi:predicted DCC family thiol-disulfide oxidoreductase YuxK
VTRQLLVFDGDCGFCTTSARWAGAQLPAGSRVEPWQSLDLDELGLTVEDVTSAAWWFDDRGRRHRGSKAASHALSASPTPWRALGWLLRIPPFSWLAIPAYALVARYRFKLPGGTDACRVPQR